MARPWTRILFTIGRAAITIAGDAAARSGLCPRVGGESHRPAREGIGS
jgi:hypothetical protein